MKVLLLSILLVTVAVVRLGVRVFFVSGGKFPSSHIHSSEAMRKRGIGCAAKQ